MHGVNKGCYTFGRRPLELVYKANFTDPTEAIKWEKRIKDWSRKKKEALMAEKWDDLIEYSKGKNYDAYALSRQTLQRSKRNTTHNK